jgi:hypothetical protein
MQSAKAIHAIIDGIEYKPCSRCRSMVPVDDYSRSKITSDGLRSACKGCERTESKKNYGRNRERDIARARAWQAANPEKVRETDRRRNNESRKAWRKEWENSHPEKVRMYGLNNRLTRKSNGKLSAYQKRWLSLPKNNIDHRMAVELRESLNGKKDRRRWSGLVGYSILDLMNRLTETMPEGYTWDRIEEMHIDHIIPRSLFQYDSENDSQFKACWALENLQLLPAFENISKGNRIQQ